MGDPLHVDASFAIDSLGRTLDIFTENLAIALDGAKTEQPTLRDRFAMAALQGLLARGEQVEPAPTAQEAFAYADAMLAARKAETTP